VAPVRTTLYDVASDGTIHNRFRFTVSNRGKRAAAVLFSIEHLPSAKLVINQNPVQAQTGETLQGSFEISAPATARMRDVNHFTIVTTTIPEQGIDSFAMTFLMPVRKEMR